MKIIATVCDVAGVVHAGATPESKSVVLEIPDDKVPQLLKQYLKNKKWATEGENRYTYEYLSFSLVEE